MKFISKIKREIRRYRKRKAFETELSQAKLPYIAIRFTGGLGDIINSTRFLRDLIAACDAFDFDLYTPRLDYTEWVIAEIPGVRHLFSDMLWHEMKRHYRMAIEVTGYVAIGAADWPRCALLPQRLIQAARAIVDARPRIEFCVQHHPLLDNQLARIAVLNGYTRRDYMHSMARIPYGGDTLNLAFDETVLESLGLASRPYVTVHNGFDTFSRNTRTSTKVYPHFHSVIALLKDAFPNVAVVQVGSSTSAALPSVETNLINKSSLAQTAALLRSAVLHLDNESGLVHLGSCVNARSAVFFGPTDIEYFAYPQNINFAPAACGRCWWLSENWNSQCLAGYDRPICLSDIKPEAVLERIAPILSERVAVISSGTTRTTHV